MELQQEIMSDITVHMKYAKYDAEKMRRESWAEICQRNRDMHLNHVDNLDITDENKEKLREEIENGRKNGLRVCPPCFDEDHPQLQLGKQKVIDAQALQNPRPDADQVATNNTAFNNRYPHTAGVTS